MLLLIVLFGRQWVYLTVVLSSLWLNKARTYKWQN